MKQNIAEQGYRGCECLTGTIDMLAKNCYSRTTVGQPSPLSSILLLCKLTCGILRGSMGLLRVFSTALRYLMHGKQNQKA